MTLDARNVMCIIYENYCLTKSRIQSLDLSLYASNHEKAASIIKELEQNGYVSEVKKFGQTYYRFKIEDELIEYYEQ